MRNIYWTSYFPFNVPANWPVKPLFFYWHWPWKHFCLFPRLGHWSALGIIVVTFIILTSTREVFPKASPLPLALRSESNPTHQPLQDQFGPNLALALSLELKVPSPSLNSWCDSEDSAYTLINAFIPNPCPPCMHFLCHMTSKFFLLKRLSLLPHILDLGSDTWHALTSRTRWSACARSKHEPQGGFSCPCLSPENYWASSLVPDEDGRWVVERQPLQVAHAWGSPAPAAAH